MLFRLPFLIIPLIFILFSCQTDPDPQDSMGDIHLTDHVNVQIGAISHMLVPTYPTVHIPNSMVRIYPYTTPGVNDNYLASRIFGFPVNIPSHRHGPFSLISVTSQTESLDPEDLASRYGHDFEISTPYYYSVLLEDPGIVAEYTVTEHGAAYRFTKENGGMIRLVLKCTGKGEIRYDQNMGITGYDQLRSAVQYLGGQINMSPTDIGIFYGPEQVKSGKPQLKENAGIFLDFNVSPDDEVLLKYGISFISEEQANRNLKNELMDQSFEDLKYQAQDKWEEMLGKIKVSGGTPDQQTIFYTSLYRSFERMVNITEEGRYYSPFDAEVHGAGEHDFYVDDWSWDTYRSLHPLRTILVPEKETAMIASYIRMYEQNDWMPAFPTIYGDMGAMIGHHQAAIIADAWFKGLRDYDIRKAYDGLRKNAMEGTRIPWAEGPMTELDKIYLEKGFFPAKEPGKPETVPEVSDFERRQAVAVTLEHAYDDWCLSRIAGDLGEKEDAERFASRGQNYRNVYNPEIGFVAPKTADGNWVKPYDPKAPAGVGARAYFAESNAWTYTWFVPHDITGLVGLMGGKEMAGQRLDQLFDEPLGQSKWTYLGYMPDATGLTGVFPMGNEPSFHVPYIYDLVGAPWKAQRRIRMLMDSWFRNDLMGICGDEDGGAMSSWYVFSAMGFYPVCPGYPVYLIGSPIFEKTEIELAGNKTFIIRAVDVSNENKYIQSATLGGEPLEVPWITHKQLLDGGELVFEMGPRPNKEWGSEADFDKMAEAALAD